MQSATSCQHSPISARAANNPLVFKNMNLHPLIVQSLSSLHRQRKLMDLCLSASNLDHYYTIKVNSIVIQTLCCDLEMCQPFSYVLFLEIFLHSTQVMGLQVTRRKEEQSTQVCFATRIIISVWMKIGNSSSFERGLSLAIGNFESVFSFLFISGCRDLCFIGKVGQGFDIVELLCTRGIPTLRAGFVPLVFSCPISC